MKNIQFDRRDVRMKGPRSVVFSLLSMLVLSAPVSPSTPSFSIADFLNGSEAPSSGDRQTRSVFVMLQHGLIDASRVEGKAFSREEICASPYIPVRCADLRNGYTGEPMRWAESVPGEIWLKPDETGEDLILSMGYEDAESRQRSYSIRLSSLFSRNAALNPLWKTDGGGHPDGRTSSVASAAAEMWGRSRDGIEIDAQGRFVSSLPQSDRVAYFVGKHLWRELSRMLAYKEVPDFIGSREEATARITALRRSETSPVTLQPFALAGKAFSHPREVALAILALRPRRPLALIKPLAFIDVYRNDFTGGYARQANAPEPGNYRFEVRPDGSGCLVVYGGNNAPVFARNPANGLYRAQKGKSAHTPTLSVPCPGFDDWFQ
jgi:hypothetical protein